MSTRPVPLKWWDWVTGGKNDPRKGNWDQDGDGLRRELLSAANDGIISSAAIIQGLLSGGASGYEAFIGVVALIAIGVVGTAANQYAEAAGERASIVAIIEAERRRLQMAPEEEFQELVDLYLDKGLSEELSVAVAKELTEKDALDAQLDAEFDLDEAPPASWPWKFGIYSGLAFVLGSVIPLLLLLVIPWHARGEVTLVVVVAALIFSGWIGSYSEHSGPLRAIFRTVAVGVVIFGISTAAGQLVTF